MSKSELAEWLVMILIILVWWPPIFFNWGPAWYMTGLYAISGVGLMAILIRRLRRMQEGFEVSEQMMRTKIAAEEQARGGKPSLDEKQPPDVSAQLPFTQDPTAEESTEEEQEPRG